MDDSSCCCYQPATTIYRKTHMMEPPSIFKSTTSIMSIVYVFDKFLARFSGRRRHMPICVPMRLHILAIYIPLILLFTLSGVTEACSSRSTPRPRPPTPAPRPNITFPTYKCPPAYAAYYCLNEARCFTVKIGDSLLYNCECTDGYMGSRCEYKDLDGSYLPTRRLAMLQTASIASGAFLALFLVLVLCLVFYVRWHQQQKRDRCNGLHEENGFDSVDGLQTVRTGVPELRPFGPHHQRFIPMSHAYSNNNSR